MNLAYYCLFVFALAWISAREQVFANMRTRIQARLDLWGKAANRRWLAGQMIYSLSCPTCHAFWWGLSLAPAACWWFGWAQGYTWPPLAVFACGATALLWRNMRHPHVI